MKRSAGSADGVIGPYVGMSGLEFHDATHCGMWRGAQREAYP